VTLLIDAPLVWHHGVRWSHLVSDTSLEELHAFAARLELAPRQFDVDHYDVAEDKHALVVAAGARLVRPREIVAALTAAGLRQRG
jgi:Protein of unknown function (DUF4031)